MGLMKIMSLLILQVTAGCRVPCQESFAQAESEKTGLWPNDIKSISFSAQGGLVLVAKMSDNKISARMSRIANMGTIGGEQHEVSVCLVLPAKRAGIC